METENENTVLVPYRLRSEVGFDDLAKQVIEFRRLKNQSFAKAQYLCTVSEVGFTWFAVIEIEEVPKQITETVKEKKDE